MMGNQLSGGDDDWINPTSVKDRFWLYVDSPLVGLSDSPCYGKWVITEPLESIDRTWALIGSAVQNSQLEVLEAKCSTLRYNPDCFGPGPTNIASICAYTTEESVDTIGLKLIEMVKHDIYYKTEQATRSGVYEHKAGGESLSILKTLYWNDGEPSLELKGTAPNPGWTRIDSPDYKDTWQLNRVKASTTSEAGGSERIHGKWIVPLEYGEVTEFWYRLKDLVESGELGVIEMECPAKVKLHDPGEKPRLLFYTNEKRREGVRERLARIFKTDQLDYEVESYSEK